MSIVSGIMGANAQSDAADKSAQSQTQATEAQTAIYGQQRADFEPYRQIGLGALPYVTSAVTGQPSEALDPRYTPITTDGGNSGTVTGGYDTNKLWWKDSAGRVISGQDVWNATGGNQSQILSNYTLIPNEQVSKLNEQKYRGPNGEIVSAGEVPRVQASFNPGQSPAAKYQLEHGNTELMRSLGARGLAGSGYAPSKLAELSSNVAASDWTNQYSRLLDMVKIGTGASQSTGAAANTLSSAYGTGAANLGNIYSQAGANKASLYSGMGGNAMNAGSLGLKAYNAYSSANAGMTAADYGSMTDYALGDNYLTAVEAL